MTDPTTLPDVIVVGTRLNFIPPQGGGGEVGEDAPEIGDDPGTSLSEAEVEEFNDRQTDCAASKGKDKIQAKPNSNSVEWFTHIFGVAGQTAVHEPRGGTGTGITDQQFSDARSEFGITGQALFGIVHNHPSDFYCSGGVAYGDPYSSTHQQREVGFNQYPSEDDWAYAQTLVTSHNVPADQLRLYIVGCDGGMRMYRYSDMAIYRPLMNPSNVETGPVPPLGAVVPPSCA